MRDIAGIPNFTQGFLTLKRGSYGAEWLSFGFRGESFSFVFRHVCELMDINLYFPWNAYLAISHSALTSELLGSTFSFAIYSNSWANYFPSLGLFPCLWKEKVEVKLLVFKLFPMAQVSPKVLWEEKEAEVMALENSGLFLEKVEKTRCWLCEVYLNYNLNMKFALKCLQYWIATAWSGSEVLRGCSRVQILALSFLMTLGLFFF